MTVGCLSYPPTLADFDNTERALADVETPSVQLVTDPDLGHPYGRPPVARALYGQIGEVSGMFATVLVMSESDTGKELIVRTAHNMNPRADQAPTTMNCGVILPNLVESESFSHEKDNFTGTSQCHIGCLEHACGGMTFLDEVTEMPVEM